MANHKTQADSSIQPNPSDSEFTRKFFVSDNTTFDVELAAATHIGKVRPRNEDHYAVIRRTRKCEMLLSNLPSDDVAYVDEQAFGLLIADGIGGAEFGDFASQLAIETSLQAAGSATSWLMKLQDMDAQEVRQRVSAYVNRIQAAFRKYRETDPAKNRMGTTLTAAYLIPGNAIIAHIGDSRAYLFRHGVLEQMTQDQTLAQLLVNSGADEEEVANLGHVLTNCLGAGQERAHADVFHFELCPGDRLLLCTDGLSDLVENEQIVTALSNSSAQESCDQLVEMALDQGGKDNITVIVCEILPQND